MSLRLEGVTFHAGGRALLTGVSAALRPGEVVGVLGPNGAGKTTLLRLASGVLRPSAGSVMLEDRPLGAWGRLELARILAVVTQAGQVPPDFSVAALVGMGRAPHLGLLAREGAADRRAITEALRRCDLVGLAGRLAGTLSGGERQRVVLARALAQEPRYLLLDEPTNHLDFGYQAEVLALVRREAERGLGVLAVLHDLNLAARICDRLIVLQAGRVVAEGVPAEVLSEALLTQVYGAAATVWLEPDSGLPVVLPKL